jgi:two-component system sensor histidine kinase TctE
MTENSLRRSLLRWLLWPLVSILFCGAYIAFDLAWRATQDTFDLALLDSALDLMREVHIVNGVPVLDLPAAAQQMLATSNEDRVVYVVKRRSGEVISGDPDLPITTFPNNESRQQYYDAVVDGRPVRAIALRSGLEFGSNQVDVAVAQTLKARDRIFVSILGRLLVPEILLAVVSLAVIWIGVRRGLMPAERLRREIISRSPQDLRPIEESSAPAELQPVLHAINELLARLEAALGGQQQFIANAAHQLRTPLAVLRTQLQSGPASALSAEMLRTLDRATAVADELLSRMKLEQRLAARVQWAPIRLDQVAQEAALEFAPLIAQRRLVFALDAVPLEVPADAWMLGEMVRNLLANAVRHTPHGAPLTMVVRRSAGQPELIVSDSGEGIADDLRERLFEPFAAATGGTGVGLGLSICRQLAQAMGAEVQLYNRSDGERVVGVDAVVRWHEPHAPHPITTASLSTTGDDA